MSERIRRLVFLVTLILAGVAGFFLAQPDLGTDHQTVSGPVTTPVFGICEAPADPGETGANEVSLESPLVVVEDTQSVRSLKDRFRQELLDTGLDRREIYEAYVYRIGANGILDVIEEEACHGQGHALGRVVFAESSNLEEALGVCGARCTSGCMHGVLMEAFAIEGDQHVTNLDVRNKLKAVCGNQAMQKHHKLGACVHGVGHALMVLSGYDRATGIKECELYEDPNLIYFCATGGYMEYLFDRRDRGKLESIAIDPCQDEKRFPAACYRYRMRINAKYLARRNLGMPELMSLCEPLEGLQRLGCFHGIGNAVREMVYSVPGLLDDLCSMANMDESKMCIEGVVEKLSETKPKTAQAACESFPVESRQRSICESTIQYGMYSLIKDYRDYFRVAE